MIDIKDSTAPGQVKVIDGRAFKIIERTFDSSSREVTVTLAHTLDPHAD